MSIKISAEEVKHLRDNLDISMGEARHIIIKEELENILDYWELSDTDIREVLRVLVANTRFHTT